ncbi:hypothetical protein BC828DRAFT_413575 [Blastocladiella britannica]|nr:hypothetical protein BC828DRAFT_413575 [Blastocladiella britannica]
MEELIHISLCQEDAPVSARALAAAAGVTLPAAQRLLSAYLAAHPDTAVPYYAVSLIVLPTPASAYRDAVDRRLVLATTAELNALKALPESAVRVCSSQLVALSRKGIEIDRRVISTLLSTAASHESILSTPRIINPAIRYGRTATVTGKHLPAAAAAPLKQAAVKPTAAPKMAAPAAPPPAAAAPTPSRPTRAQSFFGPSSSTSSSAAKRAPAVAAPKPAPPAPSMAAAAAALKLTAVATPVAAAAPLPSKSVGISKAALAPAGSGSAARSDQSSSLFAHIPDNYIVPKKRLRIGDDDEDDDGALDEQQRDESTTSSSSISARPIASSLDAIFDVPAASERLNTDTHLAGSSGDAMTADDTKQPMHQDEQPSASTSDPQPRRRIRRKVKKARTYIDERGRLCTEDVVMSESCSEGEGPSSAPMPPPPVVVGAATAPVVRVRAPTPTATATAASSGGGESSNKTAAATSQRQSAAAKKKAAAASQPSVLNFFGKKK